MELNPLTALSPIDGRYARQTDALRDIFSECAFMNARVRVEVEWLISLSEAGFAELPHLSDHGKAFLRGLADNFSLADCEAIKEIEKTTNHDVKAVEYWIKNQVAHDEELKSASEFVHFSCTSEDINNTSHAIMLKRGREALADYLQQIHDTIAGFAHQWAEIPMLSRTHGQTASPTTVGKEFANVAVRLERVIEAIRAVKIYAKMNGAVGNYNAHLISYPEYDWEAHSRKVVEERLGVTFNTHTIQIEPHDYMAELFHQIERANTILIDFDRDVWGYISMHFFKQKLREGEVGSSTMPHKVNPIRFENAEANFELSCSLLDTLSATLVESRWQRDLTDSTTQRNIGSALGYSLLALTNLMGGLESIHPNTHVIERELDENWEVLGEPIQTAMRACELAGLPGMDKPYEKVKELMRGHTINKEQVEQFIDQQSFDPETAARLKALTPATYTGVASQLVAFGR